MLFSVVMQLCNELTNISSALHIKEKLETQFPFELCIFCTQKLFCVERSLCIICVEFFLGVIYIQDFDFISKPFTAVLWQKQIRIGNIENILR